MVIYIFFENSLFTKMLTSVLFFHYQFKTSFSKQLLMPGIYNDPSDNSSSLNWNFLFLSSFIYFFSNFSKYSNLTKCMFRSGFEKIIFFLFQLLMVCVFHFLYYFLRSQMLHQFLLYIIRITNNLYLYYSFYHFCFSLFQVQFNGNLHQLNRFNFLK